MGWQTMTLGPRLSVGCPQVRAHGPQLLTAMIGGLDDGDNPHSPVALEAMLGLARLVHLVEAWDLRSGLLHVAIRIRPFFDSVGGVGRGREGRGPRPFLPLALSFSPSPTLLRLSHRGQVTVESTDLQGCCFAGPGSPHPSSPHPSGGFLACVRQGHPQPVRSHMLPVLPRRRWSSGQHPSASLGTLTKSATETVRTSSWTRWWAGWRPCCCTCRTLRPPWPA